MRRRQLRQFRKECFRRFKINDRRHHRNDQGIGGFEQLGHFRNTDAGSGIDNAALGSARHLGGNF